MMTNAKAQELRALGFTGELDVDGDVTSDALLGVPSVAEELTGRVLELWRSMQGLALYRGEEPSTDTLPKFYLQTRPRNRSGSGVQKRVVWFASAAELVAELEKRGLEFDRTRLIGEDSTAASVASWGPVPDAKYLQVLPDLESLTCWGQWWILGPGHRVASLTRCAHQYNLTDSCPGCDADSEEDATKAGPTGREKSGEHWNARLLRCQRLREMSEGDVPSLEEHAAVWTPGGSVVEMLKASDPDHAAVYEAARADLQAENDRRERLMNGLENQVLLALDRVRDAQKENVSNFAIAVRQHGGVRAIQNHGKEAARLEITERVWDRAAAVASETEDWLAALQAARTFAYEQLRHNATARTRNRLDGALAAVMVDTLSDLIDAVDAMLAKVTR